MKYIKNRVLLNLYIILSLLIYIACAEKTKQNLQKPDKAPIITYFSINDNQDETLNVELSGLRLHNGIFIKITGEGLTQSSTAGTYTIDQKPIELSTIEKIAEDDEKFTFQILNLQPENKIFITVVDKDNNILKNKDGQLLTKECSVKRQILKLGFVGDNELIQNNALTAKIKFSRVLRTEELEAISFEFTSTSFTDELKITNLAQQNVEYSKTGNKYVIKATSLYSNYYLNTKEALINFSKLKNNINQSVAGEIICADNSIDINSFPTKDHDKYWWQHKDNK
jgi:hypothetical protein